MKHVLFVCTGNICRSPMAEGLFRAKIAGRRDIAVSSAGISAASGQPPSRHAIEALAQEGIDISALRSAGLTEDLVAQATHIFAMTLGHQQAIAQYFPSALEKTFLVCEFCDPSEVPGIDVPDPIGMGREAYAEARDQIKNAIPRILAFLDQSDPPMSNDPAAATSPGTSSTTSGGRPSVIVGADHGGFRIKTSLVRFLRESGYEVADAGTHSDEAVDYPDIAKAVAEDVAASRHDLGVLVCTTGIGMSIAANRNPGVRAALVEDVEAARMTRRHNDSNVLCLAGAKLSEDSAREIAAAWLGTGFEGGRHERRVRKMDGGGQACAPASALASVDPQVFAAIAREAGRQRDNIELIASENFASAAVREAQGSVLTNKYAEGYPKKRWYGGCENIDDIEQLAIDRARLLFGAAFANVQPHSGSQANAAVYYAFLDPGDTILTMDLAHGGHLTHGHPKNFSGIFYNVVHYGVSARTEQIDYDHLEELARGSRPRMITAGASAYSRLIDFERMRRIADSVGAMLFVDMAHIAGLVAGGVHPSPMPHAHIVSSTTHKSLRGPRGGIILTSDEESAKKIDAMVFPGIQGGPLEHVIAAKAVCFHEALQPSFKDYAARVVANAATLAKHLAGNGYRIVSGGTDNHLFMVDVRPKDLNGKEAQETLDKAGITVNKNAIPFDTLSPFKAGGIRIGTPAVTTRGMTQEDMRRVGELLHEALQNRGKASRLEAIRGEVAEWNKAFALP